MQQNTSDINSSRKIIEAFIELLEDPFVLEPGSTDFSTLIEKLPGDINQLATLILSWAQERPYICDNLNAILSPKAGPGNKAITSTPSEVAAYNARIIENTMRLSPPIEETEKSEKSDKFVEDSREIR
jgi:hypothetical protein